eukprot:TRINITY_DN2792_c0_g1_i1.p1 TRINITY_DN2792_c0_g1~~TRINITY_DN2792_c0_g1_i1.p1  ORF type:complete len:1347 (-),score=263.94 TRINITY_DN2792_c0_g1_i1:23-4063(-)
MTTIVKIDKTQFQKEIRVKKRKSTLKYTVVSLNKIHVSSNWDCDIDKAIVQKGVELNCEFPLRISKEGVEIDLTFTNECFPVCLQLYSGENLQIEARNFESIDLVTKDYKLYVRVVPIEEETTFFYQDSEIHIRNGVDDFELELEENFEYPFEIQTDKGYSVSIDRYSSHKLQPASVLYKDHYYKATWKIPVETITIIPETELLQERTNSLPLQLSIKSSNITPLIQYPHAAATDQLEMYLETLNDLYSQISTDLSLLEDGPVKLLALCESVQKMEDFWDIWSALVSICISLFKEGEMELIIHNDCIVQSAVNMICFNNFIIDRYIEKDTFLWRVYQQIRMKALSCFGVLNLDNCDNKMKEILNSCRINVTQLSDSVYDFDLPQSPDIISKKLSSPDKFIEGKVQKEKEDLFKRKEKSKLFQMVKKDERTISKIRRQVDASEPPTYVNRKTTTFQVSERNITMPSENPFSVHKQKMSKHQAREIYNLLSKQQLKDFDEVSNEIIQVTKMKDPSNYRIILDPHAQESFKERSEYFQLSNCDAIRSIRSHILAKLHKLVENYPEYPMKITILIDDSGSMYDKAKQIKSLLTMYMEILYRLEIEFSIIRFGQIGEESCYNQEILKSFSQPFSDIVGEYVLEGLKFIGGTYPYTALRQVFTQEEFIEENQFRSILLITDGITSQMDVHLYTDFLEHYDSNLGIILFEDAMNRNNKVETILSNIVNYNRDPPELDKDSNFYITDPTDLGALLKDGYSLLLSQISQYYDSKKSVNTKDFLREAQICINTPCEKYDPIRLDDKEIIFKENYFCSSREKSYMKKGVQTSQFIVIDPEYPEYDFSKNKSLMKDNWKYLEQSVEKVVPRLTQILEDEIFPVNKFTRYISSKQGSSIDIKGVIKYELTDGNYKKIFRKKKGGGIREYNVTLLIDTSSSVKQYCTEAIKVLVSLICSIRNMGLDNKLSVYSFDENVTLLKDASSLIDEKAILFLLNGIQNKFEVPKSNDFLALQVALEKNKQNNDPTVIFCITDGFSSIPSLTKDSLSTLNDRNIQVFGISPTNDTLIRKIYSNWWSVSSAELLPDVIQLWANNQGTDTSDVVVDPDPPSIEEKLASVWNKKYDRYFEDQVQNIEFEIKLQEINRNIPTGFHIVFVVDRSGSMGGGDVKPTSNKYPANRLGGVYQACDEYIRSKQNENQDIFSMVLFDNDAEVIFQQEPPSRHLIKRALSQGVKGGTEYTAGLNCASGIIRNTNSNDKRCVMIFLSDGAPQDRNYLAALERIIEENRNHPLVLYTIQYSTDTSGTAVLTQMANYVREHKRSRNDDLASKSSFTSAKEVSTLLQKFDQISETMSISKYF